MNKGGRRAPNGQALPFFSERDGYWHVFVNVGTRPDGKPMRKHIRARTRQECADKAEEVRGNKKRHRIELDAGKMTVENWLAFWLSSRVAIANSQNTYAQYESIIRVHVAPAIGHVLMSKIGPAHIEAVYAAMLRSGLSASSVGSAKRILNSSFNHAKKLGMLHKNPVKAATAPRIEKRPIDILSPQESRQVLAHVRNRQNGCRWSIAFSLGLRQGEVLALRWEDIDFDAATIRVAHSMMWKSGTHGCQVEGSVSHTCGQTGEDCPQGQPGGWLLKSTKTGEVRVLPMPPGLAAELRHHKSTQNRRRLVAGSLWVDHGFVFTTRSGEPIHRRNDRRTWDAICRRLEMRKVSVHAARHTATTHLMERGVHPVVLKKLLGWSTMEMMAVYAHVLSKAEWDAAEVMQSLWEDEPKPAREPEPQVEAPS